ncbi:BnaC05g27000D [Brassica napus]|uniref:BnaC05g27000D protein n=2 Tax=Brassica TaxID=3705 RepID=A0A078HCZ6_BRANA|nr:BnaC05g27000D [Brassica napus]VDD44486.1 unnamed protein product [Brassica oleracea]
MVGSVNDVRRETSSYSLRRDDLSQLRADLEGMKVHLETMESLLDVFAVGNPEKQWIVEFRRHNLGISYPP